MLVAELVEAAEHLLGGRQGRLAAATLRASLVDLYEFWLTKAAAAAGVDTAIGGVALVAVGGLGRRELVPYADLDLVLVHTRDAGDPVIDGMADGLWYPLWDAGVGLDHSVRTPAEAIAVADDDVRTALGLLEARWIAGDPELASELASAARTRWQRTARQRVDGIADAVRQRWRLSGEIGQMAEPDLKHSGGGLRDLGLLEALAAAQLTDRPDEERRQAKALLLDVRTELRLELRRGRDVLDAEHADVVSERLGFADRFALARQLSAAGRAVRYALDVALRTAAGERRSSGRPVRIPLGEGVVAHDGEVALARAATPAKDPELLLRVASAAARTGLPISPGALRTLTDTAPELRAPWPASARNELVAMLGAGEGLTNVVEALDSTGLWARLFPEWGAVRDLPPREPVHQWTVDRHLVQTCVEAARLATSVARPDLLAVAALLHDIGKGRDTDHSVLGAKLAAQVAERIGFAADDVRVISTVVRHHLLLPDTAQRRDVTEAPTVQRVVDTIDADPLVLDLLHALAEADGRATGRGTWTAWKAGLVGDLVARCRTLLQGERLVPRPTLDDAQRSLALAAKGAGRAEVAVAVNGPIATVCVAAPPGIEVLVPAAGVLALQSLAVHRADLHHHAGVRVAVLEASPRFGTPPDVALLREKLLRATNTSLPLSQLVAAKERDYRDAPVVPAAPRVLWFDDEAAGPDTVVLELRAVDRIGLLYRVADALRACDVQVRWARIATLGTSCVDSFALRPWGRRRDAEWRRGVETAVLAAASTNWSS